MLLAYFPWRELFLINSSLIYQTVAAQPLGGWVCIYVLTIYMWHHACGVPGSRLAGSSRVRRSESLLPQAEVQINTLGLS